jgi:hypothetical protein
MQPLGGGWRKNGVVCGSEWLDFVMASVLSKSLAKYGFPLEKTKKWFLEWVEVHNAGTASDWRPPRDHKQFPSAFSAAKRRKILIRFFT